MYKIASQIYDENKIQIHFIHNDEIISNKFLDLDFNGDKTPTFADSRYVYNSKTFNEFIENIKNCKQDVFSFDMEDDNVECGSRYDGIFYHNGDEIGEEKLIFTNAFGKSTLSVHINLKCNKDIIIADLITLKENIDDLISVRYKYLQSLEFDNEDNDRKEEKCTTN
jgi:hypothetical protein